MKRFIAILGCAVLLAAAPSAAMAQETKTAKGSVSAVGANSITVKVGAKDMTFAVDATTKVVAPGGSTKTREAKAEGKAGPMLTELIKVGAAVEVSYHEQGMHAAIIQSPPPPPPAAPKPMTATGVVSAVSVSSLTIKGKTGDQTFAIDTKTTVEGKGAGTADRKTREAGEKPTITTFVQEGDTVTVTYRDVAGTNNASLVRIVRKKL
jgi:uncharacterized protein DUF5666